MVIQWVLRFLLTLWLAKASAEPASLAKLGCQDTCAKVTIPYPFGIGLDCAADDTFLVTCNTSFSPPRAFIPSINLELLDVSLSRGTIRVNNPVIAAGCPGWHNDSNVDLQRSPFMFSITYNRFTAMGCNNVAVINWNGAPAGGCMSFCQAGTEGSGCYGINCCQTTIPRYLRFFNTTFTSIHNRSKQGACKYAFIVEQEWFTNLTSPYTAATMHRVPAVLDWRTYEACSSLGMSASASANSSLCGANAFCSNGTLCSCYRGYDGNPYLADGCHDIDECADPAQNPCEKICVNMPGLYRCSCPSGYTSLGYHCYKDSGNRSARMAIIGTTASIGTLLLLGGMWWLYRIMKKRKKALLKEKFFKRNGGLLLQQQLSSGEEGNVEKTKLFTSKELDKATDHYNEDRILGQGGQGTVYKGMLTDGRIVAIKKSKIENEGKLEQFINEVVILSQINHRNVVKLHGCCLETEVPMLVYEFIPNGTLFEYIHDEHVELPLTWDMRLRIAAEIAGALSYLHSAASVPIYHRDIKSTNILLDEKYRAKVADFGTSRSISVDRTHLTTRVTGTFGYLDPEYFQSNQFTEKSDVYSFGVVLVELLTGQRPISSTRSEDARSLATHFLLAMAENRVFDIIDARVAKDGEKEEIRGVANLAKRCLNLDGRRRPTMKEVAMELERLRMSNGKATIQQDYEEVEYIAAEPSERWDATATSTQSFVNHSASSSIDFHPLLYQ
ncbi:hypothetical protein RJ639_007401 [Escallonia herrerae]|uniref:Uncharacterized protein n=1 Tax=Escallonia herrerae TaxID=1293975 RepID=A0AA88VWZ5_9ASTE|nr:hypothetical protein RJ639_007401 [Escallonia herrerae]